MGRESIVPWLRASSECTGVFADVKERIEEESSAADAGGVPLTFPRFTYQSLSES